MKRNLIVEDIINCTKGELVLGNRDFECKGFTTDTRKINKDDVYIGIKGEKSDGNMLWEEAFQKGAKVVIVQNINFENENISIYKDKIIIKVQDTIKALSQIATAKRELYGENFPVVAVTGSVGKTSTKDIIASVLSKKYNVLKTQGNNNNGIGLPLTILRLQDEDVAVIEMGMNHFGEIRALTNIAKPTISVITNIGTSHIGNLGSRENILKAKLEILEGMKNKILVVNNDNDLLHNYYEKNKNDIDIYTFGIENESDVMAKNIKLKEDCSEFICRLNNKEFNVKVPTSGTHFVLNSLCAALIGNMLELSTEQIKKGIEELELSKKRMEIIEVCKGIKIINDSYNASYESTKAVLEYLNRINVGRKIAVLGDMFELGNYSEELHKKVGIEVVKNNIDILITCGQYAKYIAEEAEINGMKKEQIYNARNLEEIENILKQIIKENDNILLKASNGMKFFQLAEKLIQDLKVI